MVKKQASIASVSNVNSSYVIILCFMHVIYNFYIRRYLQLQLHNVRLRNVALLKKTVSLQEQIQQLQLTLNEYHLKVNSVNSTIVSYFFFLLVIIIFD